MKICKICGKAMDDSYSVCPYCGAASEPSGNPNPDPQGQQQGQPNPPYGAPYTQTHSQQQYYGGAPYGQAEQNPYQQPYPPKNNGYTPAPRPQRSAYIAAILAFFGGIFGLHNFYLDNKNRAICQLVVSIVGFVVTLGIATLAMEIWAIVEGLQLLRGDINTDGTGALIKMSF